MSYEDLIFWHKISNEMRIGLLTKFKLFYLYIKYQQNQMLVRNAKY